ncbi:hypothetical protein KDA11_06090, partial [Candidatus Saccharibacteria bacterium]|nr:hypothetical protein [Candidatus Saccharibacteria bacterium]
NRKAHYEAGVKCRQGYYALKIPFSFLIAVNLLLSALEILGFTGSGRIAFVVISAVIAMLILFMDLVISLLSWSEAREKHANTVQQIDSLRFEIQREYYTEIEHRRKWEPLMVFITEKINQINSTKCNDLLSKNYDDSLMDVMSLNWRYGNKKQKKEVNNELEDLMTEADMYFKQPEHLEPPRKNLWKNIVDRVMHRADSSSGLESDVENPSSDMEEES